MTKIVNVHIGFHYLSTEIQLHTLILLELTKMKDKSITHNIFRIQDNEPIYYVWILLYRFHRIYARRKNFVRIY